MAMRDKGRRIYKTANGKNIDLDLLIQRNELTPAVGNMRVNARGDELGPGGKIVRKREDVVRDYYNQTASMPTEKVVKADSATEDKQGGISAEEAAEWEEDSEGNFVKKEQ